MITLTIILICSVLIYLVWNQCKIFELQNKIKDLNNEFNAKTIEKFIELETDLIKIKDWQNWTDGKTFSFENHIEVLNKSLKENVTLIYTQLERIKSKIKNLEQSKTKKNDFNIKYELLDNTARTLNIRVTELEKTIYSDVDNWNFNNRIEKLEKIVNSDFNSILINDKLKYLENEIDNLKMITSSPVYESYKSFIVELENHKERMRTIKGRVRLNKELIENMIVDGKLEKLKSYTFADLQTILMEYLQCKKVSTSSKIFRLTEKGLLKRYISEAGSLWSVNI